MRSGASSRPTGSEVGHAVGRSSPRRPCAPMARSAPGPGPRAGALAARRGGDDRGPLLSSRSGPRHVPSPAARSRIRLEAQDTALSRRRSPVRIRYAVPTPNHNILWYGASRNAACCGLGVARAPCAVPALSSSQSGHGPPDCCTGRARMPRPRAGSADVNGTRPGGGTLPLLAIAVTWLFSRPIPYRHASRGPTS